MTFAIGPEGMPLGNITAPEFRLRYKPETFLMVSPCLVPPLVCARLFVAHCTGRVQVRFQALYLRIAILFPFMSAALTVGYFFPEYTLWLDLLLGMTESYIITCFYALMVAWAWQLGIDVQQVLFKGALTKGPFQLPYLSTDQCCLFKSKEGCFLFHTISVYQLIFARAALELVVPTYMTVSQGISKTDASALEVPRALSLSVAVIKPLPLVWAMKTVLVCYLTLKRTKPSALRGLNAVRKFLLLKLVFYFFIINKLIQRLVDPRPLFCRQEKSQLAQFVCKVRFRYWVGLVQVAILSLLLLSWFATTDFQRSDMPSGMKQIEKEDETSIMQLLCRTISFGDVHGYYVYPPDKFRNLPSKQKEPTLEKESTKVLPLRVS